MATKRPEAYCLFQSQLHFPGEINHYRGKVRDVHFLEDRLIMAVSDRISAFDHILPCPIPYKGQVLNLIAAHFLYATRDIVPNWLDAIPHHNIAIGKKCEPIRLEMVVRGHLTGHAWRTYKSGKRILCGVPLPEGMQENQAFEHPIITPATKADEGHDEDISAEEILKQQIVTPEIWSQLVDYSLGLFSRGQEMARQQGLILVDTKYEFGKYDGKLILIDEIHTPDSSRYFYLDGFEERQKAQLPQKQLSKEFVREWLMDHDFQGLDGQVMPEMPDEFVWLVSERYRELYEILLGQEFPVIETDDLDKDIESAVKQWLANQSSS